MKLKVIFFCFTLLTLITAMVGLRLYFDARKTAILKEARAVSISRAQSIKNSISQLIKRYQNITLSLSRHPELKTLLVQPSVGNLNRVNQLLDINNASLNTSVCYLMNRDGLTIASSNRDDKSSFVGKGYAFRPYFQNAAQGIPFVYLALGVTSGTRGIYFSSPVYDDRGTIIGVFVIKEDVAKLEAQLLANYNPIRVENTDFVFMIDENGVIFFTNQDSLLYRTLWEAEPSTVEKIAATRQFGKGPWPWAGFSKTDPEAVVDLSGRNYYPVEEDVGALPGWKVVYLNDTDAISANNILPIIKTTGYVYLFLFVFLVLVLFILNYLATQAAKSLKDSETRYRIVTETVDEGIILQSASGEILTWNKGAEKILGISAEDAIGRTFEEKDWPTTQEDGSMFVNRGYPSARTLTTGEAHRNQVMGVQHPSGEHRWISVNTNPLWKKREDPSYKGREKKLYAVAISISDITENERSRINLQESKAMLQAAMDFSPAGIVLVAAPEGKIIYVNDSAMQIRRGKREDIVDGAGINQYISHWQVFHFDGTPYEKDELPLTRALKYGEISTKECIVRQPDQEERTVLVNAAPIKNDSGRIVYGIVIFLDVTDQKNIQEALRKSDERLKLALDSVSDAVWDWQIDTGELYLSSRWYTMLGYEPYEFPQDYGTWRDLLHPDDVVEAEARLAEHLKSSESFEIEFRMRTKDNQWRWILSRGKTVEQDDQGRASRMLGTHMDITERKKAEKEHQKLMDRLMQAQKMESIGLLAGGIAHDFNNILSSVIGFTDLALEEVQKGTVLEDSLLEVYSAGIRAKDLVKQILAFARQSDEERNPIQPKMIVKEVLSFIRSTIPTTIEIRQEINSDAWILANSTQVHQVLMNLCTNAAHAMEESGGVLDVSMQDVSFKKQEQPAELKPGDYIEIKFSDTGTGISDEISESIFEPYFTTKEVGDGTGMGLAMVHGVIESYGGKITVDSELGKGSTFTIHLPVIKKTSVSEEDLHEQLPTGNECILFVDDEVAIAKMSRQMLKKLGYSVDTRTSSVEALELFRSKPNEFDLVITDMTMPDLTGDTLAVEMMKIRPDIPVILCTGFGKKFTDNVAKEIGIKAFAHKPVDKAELAKTVRKLLDEVNSKNQGQ